ncbi:hypothetical protein DL96DRAFT_627165 [Flagelloscypha sp. PMI_526]|nr:hypothetical protein DL96DRAFT_627165 [Flagelloscypha sp. PMI_526]
MLYFYAPSLVLGSFAFAIVPHLLYREARHGSFPLFSSPRVHFSSFSWNSRFWFFRIFVKPLAGWNTGRSNMYHISFQSDPWRSKGTVYAVFVFELLQTALQMSDFYQRNVQHWGDPTTFLDQNLQWLSVTIITGISAAIVQSSFGWRILVLSNSRIWPSMVWFLAIIQLGANLANGILAKAPPLYDVHIPRSPLVILWGVSTALNDVLIAVLLSFYLRRMKSAFEDTNTTVSRIVNLIVGSGTLTAVLAIATVLLYLFSRPEFNIFPSVLSKIYANSLLVMLNQRMNFQNPTNIIFNSFRGLEETTDDNTLLLVRMPQASEVIEDTAETWDVYEGSDAGTTVEKRLVVGPQ